MAEVEDEPELALTFWQRMGLFMLGEIAEVQLDLFEDLDECST